MRVFIPLLVVLTIFLVDLASGQNSPEPVETLQPQYLTEYGSKMVKTRYGPYSVPSNDMKHFQESSIELPCRDCLVTWIQAGLEYSDGTVAGSSNQMWLHHMFLTNMNRGSKVCPEQGYDRFFATGEERTIVNICANGKEKAGYYIAPTDTITMATEIMNLKQDLEPANVTVTITWEYVPGIPSSFSQVEAYWLDISGCGPSAQPAYPDTSFNYTSKHFISNSTGHITFMGSHLHDGGTHLEIQKNDVTICNTTASYYEGGNHISSISSCTSDSMLDSSPASRPLLDGTHDESSNVKIKQNDTLSIIAYYDTSLHKPMSFHANSSSNPDSESSPSLEPIMGITLLYIALDPTSPTSDNPNPHTQPSKTLLLSLLILALFAITIVTLSRMYTENKTFTDLCPHLTPCLGVYLLIQDRFFPSWSSSREYYYDDEEEGGYYEDEDDDEEEDDAYGEDGGINLKTRTNANTKGKGREDGNSDNVVSRPLLSVKERERQELEMRRENEEVKGEGGGGWDWEYENDNENEDENENDNGAGSGSRSGF